jgi:hypothetical protein
MLSELSKSLREPSERPTRSTCALDPEITCLWLSCVRQKGIPQLQYCTNIIIISTVAEVTLTPATLRGHVRAQSSQIIKHGFNLTFSVVVNMTLYKYTIL